MSIHLKPGHRRSYCNVKDKHNDSHGFEVYLRYMISQLYSEHGKILVVIEAHTVGACPHRTWMWSSLSLMKAREGNSIVSNVSHLAYSTYRGSHLECLCFCAKEGHLGVSVNRGPQHRPHHIAILALGTSKKGAPNLGTTTRTYSKSTMASELW